MASITLTVSDSVVPAIQQMAKNSGFAGDTNGIRDYIKHLVRQQYIAYRTSEIATTAEQDKQIAVSNAETTAKNEFS